MEGKQKEVCETKTEKKTEKQKKTAGTFSFINLGETPDPSLGWSSLAGPKSGGIFSSVSDKS